MTEEKLTSEEEQKSRESVRDVLDEAREALKSIGVGVTESGLFGLEPIRYELSLVCQKITEALTWLGEAKAKALAAGLCAKPDISKVLPAEWLRKKGESQ